MQTIKKDVKHKNEVVAQVEIPVYDTLQEMIEGLAGDNGEGGEAVVLELANRMLGTDIMNAKRGEFRPNPESKTALRGAAMKWAAVNDADTFTDICKAGDQKKLFEYLDDITVKQGIKVE